MNQTLQLYNPQQAHVVLADLWPIIKATLTAGKRLQLTVKPEKRSQALAGTVYPTTKPDIDNVEKAIFDGLNGVVWRDDVQVVEVHKRKRYGDTPGVSVTVIPIGVLAPVMVNREDVKA